MGGRGVAAGVSLPFAMAGPIKTPHFSFLSERKEKRAVHGPKRKERLLSLVENFGLVEPKREVQLDLPLRLSPLPLLLVVVWAFVFGACCVSIANHALLPCDAKSR